MSKEVSDACSSVTSDVRDMLVCLVSSGARRELERKNDPDEEATLAEASDVERLSFSLASHVNGHCTARVGLLPAHVVPDAMIKRRELFLKDAQKMVPPLENVRCHKRASGIC